MTAVRWASPRARVIYGVNHMARRSVRDVVREARKALRAQGLPSDPWFDACVAGRSGNACADFLVRFAHALQVVGTCPAKVRATLVDIAHRVADATLPRQAAA